MSLRSAVAGAQEPRVHLTPRAAWSEADDASFLSSSYGLTPDPWQHGVLESWLGLKSDGRWAAARCGLAVPRQNGKNGVLEVRELFGMVARGEKFLHTAHEVKTARKAFLRLASFFENARQFPELAELVLDVRRTNGQEAITLKNGGSCEFIARSKGSGRGFTVDVLVMDEAQELSEDSLAALLPTISAAPSGNPQQIMTGTPPSESMDGAAWLRMRTAGVDGKDRRLSWHEWSCDGTPDLDDPRVWASANPSLGGRLSAETVADERAAMDDDTFMRERLGMWASAGANRVIPVESWQAVADAGLQADSSAPVAFAVDVSPDRSTATIAGASVAPDGNPFVAVLDTRRGSPQWLVNDIVERCARNDVRAVVVDAASAAASLVDQLEQKRIRVTVTGSKQMREACGGFFDAVVDRKFWHLDQTALNVALAGASKRELEGAWAWNRKTAESDITPLVAATLALWGLSASGVKRPKRKAGSGRVVVM